MSHQGPSRRQTLFLVFELGGVAAKSCVPTSHANQADREPNTKLDTAKALETRPCGQNLE